MVFFRLIDEKDQKKLNKSLKTGPYSGKKETYSYNPSLKTDILSHWCCRLAGRFAEDHGDTFASGNLETSPSIAALWAAQEAELAKEASTLVGKCDKHGER